MQKRLALSCMLICIVLMLTASIVAASGSKTYERKIILFDNKVKPEAQDALIRKYGYRLKHLHLINAAVAVLPSEAQTALAKSPGVIGIENDGIVVALGGKTIAESTQALPWGIDRINADLVWPVSIGSGVKVAVIDTGIDIAHPDLAANVKGGFNAINRKASANDDHGHGSHVAGIVAAVDNSIGVIGAAPKAELFAVKVLDKTGSGRISDVIEGLQWAVDNRIQVANMSLGTTTYSKALHKAVKNACSTGLIIVAAAGNNGPGLNTVNYPARFNEVIAVAATDENNLVTSFSSRGPEIDVAAPGSNIYSTFNNGGYATLNGTSMAAPHVTGAVALKLQINPELTPLQILEQLKRTASYLQNTTPEEQGSGLVDAAKLISAR
ncbi:MAG: S8 family peptidase [Actinobacteria bacterium]|nr:S8 family peptidase [Actinomycetota bacterium]